jgi:lipopolysaccharide transport system permease protein
LWAVEASGKARENDRFAGRKARLEHRVTVSAKPIAAKTGVIAELGVILREIWGSKDLLYQLTRRDITIRYKQAVMGFAWAILMPLLIVLSGMMIRLAMSKFAGRPLVVTTLASIAVKAIPWAFFVGAIGFATPSLSGNLNLVTKIYFPREVLTLSTVLAQTKDAGVGLLVLAIMLPFLGVTYGWTLLWVPVLLLLTFVFTAAAGLFLACANLFFRDVKYLVQVFLTFGIFFTPVFYEPSLLPRQAARVVMLNPLAPLLEGMNLAVVRGHNLLTPIVAAAEGATVWSPWFLAYSAAWAIGGLLLSLLLFRRLSYLFAEYV